MSYALGTPSTAAYKQSAPHTRPQWSPYDDNGGTAVAVAGGDYCIIAASTRLSSGYSILTRESSKIVQLSEKVVLVSAGFQGDIRTLQKLMQSRNVAYQHNHRRPMGVKALAQMLGNTLYYKRFFPYYTWNLTCGLDDKGQGAVYTYDPVGNFERVGYSCQSAVMHAKVYGASCNIYLSAEAMQGSGKDLIQPVLDNQLKAASPLLVPPQNWMTSLPENEAVDLIKDAFVAAGERDIYTGDAVEILVITKDGTRRDTLELKKD